MYPLCKKISFSIKESMIVLYNAVIVFYEDMDFLYKKRALALHKPKSWSRRQGSPCTRKWLLLFEAEHPLLVQGALLLVQEKHTILVEASVFFLRTMMLTKCRVTRVNSKFFHVASDQLTMASDVLLWNIFYYCQHIISYSLQQKNPNNRKNLPTKKTHNKKPIETYWFC